MSIQSDDKEFFKKIREIWNKIILKILEMIMLIHLLW